MCPDWAPMALLTGRYSSRAPFFPSKKGVPYRAKDRSIRFLTFDTCHRPPRAVRTPRLLSAAASPRRSRTPDARSELDDRQDVGGEDRGFLRLNLSPERRRLGRVASIPQSRALSLPRRQRRPCPLRDQPPLLLGESSVQVQHERVCIRAQFGDDERNPLRHEAGNERDVAGEPVELGDDDRAFACTPCCHKRGCWPRRRAAVRKAVVDRGAHFSPPPSARSARVRRPPGLASRR